jgi:hypothetical protein
MMKQTGIKDIRQVQLIDHHHHQRNLNHYLQLETQLIKIPK